MKKLIIVIAIASLSVLAVAGILTQYGEISTTVNVIDPTPIEIIFNEPLEEFEDWTIQGWEYPGIFGNPCVGTGFSAAWKNGTYLTTPTIKFYNKTEISFQYNVEDDHTVKENLSLYLDYKTPNEELLWKATEITDITCQQVTINLDDSYAGEHTITWLYNKRITDPEDKWGIVLDDITVRIVDI